VRQTDRICEVWASVVDYSLSQGTRTFVPTPDGAALDVISPDASSYLVSSSHGPFQPCSGGSYVLRASFISAPISTGNTGADTSPPPHSRRALSCSGFYVCMVLCHKWTSKASKLANRLGVAKHDVASASGAKAKALRHRIRRLTRRYRRALRRATFYCDRAARLSSRR
jgi:hypothetical protein